MLHRDYYHTATGHTDVTFIAVPREIGVNYERVCRDESCACACARVHIRGSPLKFLHGARRRVDPDSELRGSNSGQSCEKGSRLEACFIKADSSERIFDGQSRSTARVFPQLDPVS